jgi:hypothetical protein
VALRGACLRLFASLIAVIVLSILAEHTGALGAVACALLVLMLCVTFWCIVVCTEITEST